MKNIIRNFLILFTITLILSCNRDEIIRPKIEPVPFTENSFKYELLSNVTMVDSSNFAGFIEVTENAIIFEQSSVIAADAKVGDILFIPQAVESFHLTKMAFKVAAINVSGSNIEIDFTEPELKEIYEEFYLEVNNENDIQFRDTTVDWTSLTQLQIDEIKLVNATMIELSIPLSSSTTFTFKIGNVTAVLEFQYRYSTSYLNGINSLVNFEFGMKDIIIKNFTFQAEVEVKNDGNANATPGVAIAGISNGKQNIIRVPTPFLAAVGIPLTANVDFSPDFEAALTGKLTGVINFGTFTFTGDPLVVQYDVLGLETALWVAMANTFGTNAAVGVFGGPGNVNIISYPDSYTVTGDNCLSINTEFSGSLKPFVGLGVSFSLLGIPTSAVGVYTQAFIEFVGKITTMTCLGPGGVPPTTTPGACIEINRGIKLPYLMASSKATSPNPIEYNVLKFAILGEVKDNILTWPAGCDPSTLISTENVDVTTSVSCSGDRAFVNFNVDPPSSIASPTTFKVVINSQEIPGLPYNFLTSFYLDEHNLGNTSPETFLAYEIFEESNDALIAVGQFFVNGCSTEGCTIVEDTHLPTYPDQEYCEITPFLPNYNRDWIIDEMYYTSISSGFDPFNDGRCYNDSDANCKDFGRLYTWHAANGPRRNVSDFASWPGEDICPLGYHVPSKIEWEALIDAAGGQNGNSILSSASWPNLFDMDRNLSGFGAFPNGIYVPGGNGGASGYQGLGEIAGYWTSTEADAVNGDSFAYAVYISSENGIELKKTVKNMGLSCRCIKDN